MTDRFRNVIVGITALVGMFGLGFLALLFGAMPAWIEGGYQVRVLLPDAAGLSEGSRVTLSGIDVGRVETVALAPDPADGVAVTVRLREEVEVPAAASVSVGQGLIGGSPKLLIVIRDLSPDLLADTLAKDGSASIRGEVTSLMDQLGQRVDDGLAQLRSDLVEPREALTKAQMSFSELSQSWTRVGDSVNALMAPRSTGDVDAGEIVGNVATVVARADARLRELEGTLAQINQWLGDEDMRRDFKQAASQLNQGAAEASDLMKAARADLRDLMQRYITLADDLAGVAGEAQTVLARVNEGEGVVGRLLTEPRLFEAMNETVDRLQQAVAEVEVLIRQWQEEGVSLDLFD